MTDAGAIEIGNGPPRSKAAQRFARIFVWLTAIASVATFGFGWWVVRDVKRTASETDLRLRTIAWATLSYASAYRQFPESDDELVAFGVGPESITTAPPTPDLWPTLRSGALNGLPPASIADSLRSVIVVWGDSRSMPPLLKADELPTLKGTEPEVNRWLEAYRGTLDSR